MSCRVMFYINGNFAYLARTLTVSRWGSQRFDVMFKHSCCFVATVIFLLVINVDTTSALDDFENVHTYNYAATIRVGVDGHDSEYQINGLLKIQRVKTTSNRYVFSLSEVKHNSYYGVIDHAKAGEYNPIDHNSLQIPFYVTYNYTDHSNEIDYAKDEPDWSRKIKKNIASLLQVNWSIVRRVIPIEGHANDDYDVKEMTMHGECSVKYLMKKANQHSKFKETYFFTKSYNLNGCDDFAHSINGYITNYKFTKKDIQCSSGWNDSTIRNIYKVDTFNGSWVIEKIINEETYKFNNNADNDNVVVMKDNRQFLVKIEQTVFFNDTNLDEQLFEDINVNKGHTFTSSNANVTTASPTGLVDKIKNILLEALVYTKKNHLNVLDRDAEHKQLFNKLHSYIKRLEPVDFSFLESEIIKNPNLDKIRNIFISMLPYAGSKHSFDFTLDIITKKIISDDLAIDLLTKLPIYAPVSIDTVTEVLNTKFFESESHLSPKVYESAILCYSQILSKFSNSELGDVIVENHLPKIVRAFEAASSTTSKLVFLSAIGNIRHNATVKYILPILTGEQDVGAKDQDRLRLAAINILSSLIIEDDMKNWAYSNLTTILKDDSESKPIRLAAYDFLISKSNYAIELLIAVGQMISHDKDLYNYHLSTIEGLKRVGIIDRHAKFDVRHTGRATAMSSTLSKTVIFITDDLPKAELLKSTLKIQPLSRSFLKFSLVSGNQSTKSDWQIPSVVKFEVLEENNKKLIVNDAIYFYTNFNGADADDGVFIDFWTVFNRNTRAYYVETIEFENLADILIMSDMILQKIRDKLIFAYEDLSTFSVSTGFGIDAVFEHKYPSLLSMHMDYNWGAEDNRIQAKVDFSSKLWSNGYHGVSVYNPFTGNTHSVRKTQQLDGQLLFSVIVKYDFSNRQFNLTIPVNSNDPDGMESGLAIYSSTSVGITDADNEISCRSCGFRVATTNVEPAGSLSFRRKDYLGILASKMTYNCDSNQSFSVNNLLNDVDDDKINVINRCGFIAMIRPNASKPNSQIELLINANTELSKSWEKPWYFLPGTKLHFKSSIGSRQIISNEFTRFLKLDFNTSTSQGHFSNLLQFRIVKREDDDSNFILCYDGKANFPEIDDNHLPTEITQSKLTASSRIAMGQSKDESCSTVDFAIDFNLIGEVSEDQRNLLKNYVEKSQCTLQQAKWLYIYVKEGEYPLTEACIREMISNTTLRRYKLDLKSDKFSDLSLLQTLLIIRNMQDKLEGIIQNSHSSAVDVEMISPIADIRTKKHMTFQASYPATGIYKNVPNIYFPQEFVVDFIDKKINVINVYHEMIFYNNEEKPFSGLDDWKEICAGVEKPTYRVYAKVMHEDRMSFKIMYKGYELIMEPKLISSTLKESNEPSYVPEIYYNQQLFNDFHQRLHLFSSQEILFSLSRVDEYMVVRSTEIPVIIYYTTDCINIFQRT